MAEQYTEHETDDVFMVGELIKRYDGVQIEFVPSHLKPRLTFEKTHEINTNFNDNDEYRTELTIGVYFDGKYIGGIEMHYAARYNFCRTWANNPMPRWNAEQLSADNIKRPFKDGNESYHPSFNNLSELLLYHLSKDV